MKRAAAFAFGAATCLATSAHAQSLLEIEPAYADLFVDGTVMVFDLTRETAMWDDHDPAAGPDGVVRSRTDSVVRCEVRQLFHTETTAASEVTCDGDGGQLEGFWQTRGDGLWKLLAEPEDAASSNSLRTTEQPLLPPVLAESIAESEGEEGHGSRYSITHSGDEWCAQFDAWGGDEVSSMFCVAPGSGVPFMSYAFAGGSDMTSEWTLRGAPNTPRPTSQPTSGPTSEPTSQPTSRPTSRPASEPTSRPSP